ncbi:uncharacterized protein LOC127263558 isoform X2 [Andrographis paniculata]|uniref:uncharacterized protein LOC127263558 isoform X2 n=1 Tax=Andrographis paniculata TaxID=175694 RepID=UPI0021E760EA|nr:uncharacterized protein LOC127263558 isoform X2 [Andrographis paniculata]
MAGALVVVFAAVILHAFEGGGAVVVPITSCYALDNTSHIHDFSNLIGQIVEYDDDKANDLVVRFCKDVETRSQPEYYGGDLMNCEKTYDKLGRTAQVNIICGNCPSGQCTGGLGCICNVTYESACRVLIDLAIPCGKPALRVFEGFTVGFNPRSWEIVYNGLTQLGYEKAHNMFSFKSEQRDVTLYLTAVASLSGLVEKPMVKISPDKGLDVQLSGSGANGDPPTTLSPTMIHVEWICERGLDMPYEVEITIPIKGYDPIQFTLAKMCEHTQSESSEDSRGWAVFGIISCISIVAFTLFCCGGFIYRTRVKNLHGIDAVPGIAILSSCLETASGGIHGYTQPSDANNPFTNQGPWDRQPTYTQGTARPSERTYGSI